MGFLLKVVFVKKQWQSDAKTSISLKRCISIDMSIQHSSITASPAVKVMRVLEPIPAALGQKQRDAPQKLPVYCTATLEDKQRFTPPDNGPCLVCGRNTCGEPTQIHREQIDFTQRGPGTGNRIHSIFAVSQCQRWEDFLKVTQCNCKLPVENVISNLLSQSKGTGSDDASLLLDPFKA